MLDWELVNRLPPSGGTRNYVHSGKGPFRISYYMLTKLVALRQKSHQNLSLLNFKCAARISTPRRERGGGARAWNFENDRYKIIKVKSYPCGSGKNWCLPLKSTNSKTKNWKIPKIKTPLSMCLSQFIKIVLVMLTLGMLLSENRRWAPGEKHPKTYQLGLW